MPSSPLLADVIFKSTFVSHICWLFDFCFDTSTDMNKPFAIVPLRALFLWHNWTISGGGIATGDTYCSSRSEWPVKIAVKMKWWFTFVVLFNGRLLVQGFFPSERFFLPFPVIEACFLSIILTRRFRLVVSVGCLDSKWISPKGLVLGGCDRIDLIGNLWDLVREVSQLDRSKSRFGKHPNIITHALVDQLGWGKIKINMESFQEKQNLDFFFCGFGGQLLGTLYGCTPQRPEHILYVFLDLPKMQVTSSAHYGP